MKIRTIIQFVQVPRAKDTQSAKVPEIEKDGLFSPGLYRPTGGGCGYLLFVGTEDIMHFNI